MDWQQLVSLLIVAVATILLLRHKLRRPRFSFQKNTHCGCAAGSDSTPGNSIVFRARKGHRPEVLMKMR
jgi:hypothetical protein